MPLSLLFIALSLFTWGAGESMFFFFQPLYLEQLGASHLGIGAILGAWGLIMTISHLPAGYLADRIGRRPLLWAAWVSGMIAAWVMALAPGLSMFVAGLLLYGFTSFVISPLNSYVTAARGNLSVGRIITLIGASFNLGAIIGPLAGGYIADNVGLRQVYLFAAIIFVISNLFIFFIPAQKIEKRPEEQVKNGLLFNRRYVYYLGIVFLAMFATYLPQPLSSNYLQNQQGLTFGEIGSLGSFSSLGVVVLNLLLGQLNARLGFLLGQAAVGVFTIILWQGVGLPWFIIGYFLLGGYRTARSLATAQTQELVHVSNLGLAYGLTETMGATAIILAPPLAGFLYTHDPTWMYLLSLALIISSLMIGMVFLFKRAPGEEKAGATEFIVPANPGDDHQG